MSALPSNASSLQTLGHMASVELRAAAIAQLVGLVSFAAAALIYGLITIPTEDTRSPIAPSTDYHLTPTPGTAPSAPPNKPAAIVKGDIVPGQHGTQVITVTTVKSEIVAESIIARIGFGGPSGQTVVPLPQ
jgi:hypothetical protein